MATVVKPSIQWLHNLDEALEGARRQQKLVLLDFFSPT